MKDKDLIDHLRKLWLLNLIVEAGTFKEAAARAKVTQSALSQTVTQLEGLTGRMLLKRERGRVEATGPCLELLERVRPVLAAVEQVTRAADDEPPPLAWLTLGAFDSFACEAVPPLVTQLQLKCPGIRLTLRVARSGALAALVRKGELCMAVVRDNDMLGRLDSLPIGTDRLGFYAAPGHPAVEQGWESLPDHEIGTLSPAPDGGHPLYFKRLVEAAALKRHAALVSDSFEALCAAARQSAIVAVLPARLVQLTKSDLVEIKPQTADAKLGVHQICMISRPGCDPRENEFLAAELRQVVAELDRAYAAACLACRPAAPLTATGARAPAPD